MDAGSRVGMSVDFLPFAVLASKDQRDPKRNGGDWLTTNRGTGVLGADYVTQIAALLPRSCEATRTDQVTHGDRSCCIDRFELR